MGLDMHLTGRKYFWQTYGNIHAQRREDDKRVNSMEVQLGYWRKHPNLHGFIVNTFANGNDDCKEIELEADALKQIIVAVKDRKLPETSGFFFGKSDDSDEARKKDIKILTDALEWLEAADEPPLELEREIRGPGFSTVIVKPKPNAEQGTQKVTRSVHYRGSW